jgi:urease accessory protein
MVGGNTLEIGLQLGEASHAVITSPGAARFDRSTGERAAQTVHARPERGARLEWLPLETIACSGCEGENALHFELADGAEALGWDVLALGLPAAGQAFDRGHYRQRIELAGRRLEQGTMAADDRMLLASPLGLAGHRVLGTLWLMAGHALPEKRREALLDAARAACGEHELARSAGATSPNEAVVLLRALAPRVEPLMALFKDVRKRWCSVAWGLDPVLPRIWTT